MQAFGHSLDGADRPSKRDAGCQIERQRHRRKYALVAEQQRLALAREMSDSAQRHLRTGGTRHVDLRQQVWIVLELRLYFEHDLVLIGRSVDRRDLPLSEGVVEGLVYHIGRQPETGGGIAVDLDGEVRRGDLLI